MIIQHACNQHRSEGNKPQSHSLKGTPPQCYNCSKEYKTRLCNDDPLPGETAAVTRKRTWPIAWIYSSIPCQIRTLKSVV